MPLDRLKRRLPDEADDELLEQLLSEAGDFIRAYTGRGEVPRGLESAQVQLACAYYGRMGMEGERRRDEGGVSRTVDAAPGDILAMLRPYRLAKGVS